MHTLSTCPAEPTNTQPAPALADRTARLVAVVPRSFVTSSHVDGPPSPLRPGTVETTEIQAGRYPVEYDCRCDCGEPEAVVNFRAVLVERTTGPWWRRRALSVYPPAETIDSVSWHADEIHDGMVIDVDDAGRPVAWFARETR